MLRLLLTTYKLVCGFSCKIFLKQVRDVDKTNGCCYLRNCYRYNLKKNSIPDETNISVKNKKCQPLFINQYGRK